MTTLTRGVMWSHMLVRDVMLAVEFEAEASLGIIPESWPRKIGCFKKNLKTKYYGNPKIITVWRSLNTVVTVLKHTSKYGVLRYVLPRNLSFPFLVADEGGALPSLLSTSALKSSIMSRNCLAHRRRMSPLTPGGPVDLGRIDCSRVAKVCVDASFRCCHSAAGNWCPWISDWLWQLRGGLWNKHSSHSIFSA